MDNPKAAIDAILEDTQNISVGSEEVHIQTLTLGRYALLDALESPLVSFKQKTFKTLDLIPSFYVMTADWKDLVGYTTSNLDELKQKAMEWAGDKDLSTSAALADKIIKKIMLVGKVSPEAQEDASRKKEDAAAPTAG